MSFSQHSDYFVDYELMSNFKQPIARFNSVAHRMAKSQREYNNFIGTAYYVAKDAKHR